MSASPARGMWAGAGADLRRRKVEDIELIPDEEEEAVEEEGANRTFIILVAALGGLLALGICAFVVWAVLLAPRMRQTLEAQNQAIQATNTAVAVAVAETATAAAQPTATHTPAPTDTPTSTPTRTPTPVPPPATSTSTPATVEPTATRQPSKPGGEGVPGTGVGALGAGVLAVGLLILLVVVRRVRRTV